MDNSVLTRTYLETLSTSDLIALADDYGIDIPPELNRRFIIAELLEAAEDVNDDADEMTFESLSDKLKSAFQTILPEKSSFE